MFQAYYILYDLEATARLAQLMARALTSGGVIALIGELGAGKTALAQQLARSFGLTGVIPSPTFTLINEYRRPDGRMLYHADLYRLNSVTEIDRLGLADQFASPQATTLVEWADRAPSIFPANTVWLHLTPTKSHRVATLRSKDENFWRNLRQAAETE